MPDSIKERRSQVGDDVLVGRRLELIDAEGVPYLVASKEGADAGGLAISSGAGGLAATVTVGPSAVNLWVRLYDGTPKVAILCELDEDGNVRITTASDEGEDESVQGSGVI